MIPWPQMDFRPTTTIKTQFELLEEEGELLVKKVLNPDLPPELSLNKVKECIDRYIAQLKDCGVALPSIKRSIVDADKIIYVSNYEGPDLVTILQSLPQDSLESPSVLVRAIALISQAERHGVFLDPHPRNFVCNDRQEIHYVDFSPPLVPQYFDLRLSHRVGEERGMSQQYFAYFGSAYLQSHFVADVLKALPHYNLEALLPLMQEASWAVPKRESEIQEEARVIRAFEDSFHAKNFSLF